MRREDRLRKTLLGLGLQKRVHAATVCDAVNERRLSDVLVALLFVLRHNLHCDAAPTTVAAGVFRLLARLYVRPIRYGGRGRPPLSITVQPTKGRKRAAEETVVVHGTMPSFWDADRWTPLVWTCPPCGFVTLKTSSAVRHLRSAKHEAVQEQSCPVVDDASGRVVVGRRSCFFCGSTMLVSSVYNHLVICKAYAAVLRHNFMCPANEDRPVTRVGLHCPRIA